MVLGQISPETQVSIRRSLVAMLRGISRHRLLRRGKVQEKTNALATGTVRLGYSFGQGLIYGKGGVAWDRTDYRFFGQRCPNPTNSCVFTTPFDFTTPTDSRWGWTAGIGTEWILVGNWSIFGEYDYLDFGSKNLTFTDSIMGQAVFSVRQHINEGKLGVNFRFY